MYIVHTSLLKISDLIFTVKIYISILHKTIVHTLMLKRFKRHNEIIKGIRHFRGDYFINWISLEAPLYHWPHVHNHV